MDVSAPRLNNSESLALSKKTVAAACKGIQNSLRFCIWDSRYWISVSVNKAWILDSNHRDSRFLELYSWFQFQRFWPSPSNFVFPDSGSHRQKFSIFRSPDSLTWDHSRDIYTEWIHYMQCPNVMENWIRSWKKPWKVMGFERKKVNKRKLIE